MQVQQKDIYYAYFSRIFSSVKEFKISKYLVDLFSEKMSVAGVSIYVYDSSMHSYYLVDETLVGHKQRSKNVFQIPLDMQKSLLEETIYYNMDYKEPILINDLNQFKVRERVFSMIRCSDTSNMLIPILQRKDMQLGISVYAFGKNAFSQKDMDYCRLLQAPLRMAFSPAFERVSMTMRSGGCLGQPSLHEIFLPGETALAAGLSPSFQNVMRLVEIAASSDCTVLIHGETGVGKEVVANWIYHQSARKQGPMIRVNCGAIPDNLIDSELFGHEKGAFTGAIRTHQGCFESANNGTLFLDEIGELPLHVQPRLLRVLQFHEVTRVGSSRPVKLDLRVIAATHCDLTSMVSEGRFREDLWFRLNVFPIRIPALRERPEDIPHLAVFLIHKKCREMGIDPPPALSAETALQLQRHSWPGNVRELENCIERSLILNRSSALFVFEDRSHHDLPSHAILPDMVQTRAPDMPDAPQPAPNLQSPPAPPASPFFPVHPSRLSSSVSGPDLLDETAFPRLDEVNAMYIKKILEHTGGKIHGPDGAALILGVNASTLRSRMSKLGIRLPRGG